MKKQSTIPKQFSLHGKTITVEFNHTLAQIDNDFGQAVYNQSKVILQPSCDGWKREEDAIEATFYHELVHWILYEMGREDLNEEDFVRQFSGLLHQFEVTKQ